MNVRNGDSKAFRTLVDLYKDKSMSLACSILKNEAIAEDVLQEVFIKVYKNISSFQFNSKFSTWLYKIVYNACMNELKRKKHHVSVEEMEHAIQHTPVAKENTLMLKDQQVYIQKAMDQLKTDEALVLRLFYLCEMSLKEIEVITTFSASKIRVDLHRGRKNIKQQLEQLLGREIKHLL